MTTFAPLDDVSRRVKVLDLIDATEPGEVIRYPELEFLLMVDRRTVQSVVNQAKPSAQKQLKKSLVAIRNVGYRVLLPGEHIELAKTHQKRGRRQTRKASSAVVNTDFARLSDVERVKYDLAQATLSALQRFERRADLRYASQERVNEFVQKQGQHNERTASEVTEIKDRLAKLEELLTPKT